MCLVEDVPPFGLFTSPHFLFLSSSFHSTTLISTREDCFGSNASARFLFCLRNVWAPSSSQKAKIQIVKVNECEWLYHIFVSVKRSTVESTVQRLHKTCKGMKQMQQCDRRIVQERHWWLQEQWRVHTEHCWCIVDMQPLLFWWSSMEGLRGGRRRDKCKGPQRQCTATFRKTMHLQGAFAWTKNASSLLLQSRKHLGFQWEKRMGHSVSPDNVSALLLVLNSFHISFPFLRIKTLSSIEAITLFRWA